MKYRFKFSGFEYTRYKIFYINDYYIFSIPIFFILIFNFLTPYLSIFYLYYNTSQESRSFHFYRNTLLRTIVHIALIVRWKLDNLWKQLQLTSRKFILRNKRNYVGQLFVYHVADLHQRFYKFINFSFSILPSQIIISSRVIIDSCQKINHNGGGLKRNRCTRYSDKLVSTAHKWHPRVILAPLNHLCASPPPQFHESRYVWTLLAPPASFLTSGKA